MSFEELAELLSHDPFNVDECVETLAWRSSKKGVDGESKLEPMVLHGAFCQTIQRLKDYEERLGTQAVVLESECVDEESRQRKKVKDLLQQNQHAIQHFKSLDERINHVATKVVHLGDQLESVNVPRARNAEALHMMQYLDVLMVEVKDDKLVDEMLSDSSRLAEAVELVQKLYLIAQELPSNDPRFNQAKAHIAEVYESVENKLIDGFLQAYNYGQIEEMKRMCDLLRNFLRYNDVIDKFINESQKFIVGKHDLICKIEELCYSTSRIIAQVFFNPENVMTKFVTNMYLGVLSSYINEQLEALRGNVEQYLEKLSSLYASTTQLSESLSENLKFGTDTSFLMKLTQNKLFGAYLSKYKEQEFTFLRDKTTTTLVKYYESRNHVKRQLQAGGISDLRREVQAKMHINIGPDIDGYDGEAFLSQEIAISILQDFKLAYGRSKNLVSKKDLPQHASQIFLILAQYLCSEFMDYAIELALYHCPLPESRTSPNLHFLSAVSDTSAIVHLFEKQFADYLWPIICRSSHKEECTSVKRSWIEKFEEKLDMGLERTLMAICGYIKHLLISEQKKTDFKPEKSDMSMMHSRACSSVVQYVTKTVSKIKQQLDGKNRLIILHELGIRLHRAIYEHLLTFQYNSLGAMLAICDVNEYRTCIKQLDNGDVVSLFDVLHALCNLLVVPTDNLKQICVGEPLNLLDKPTLYSFIQLREDFKAEKLGNILGR